MEGEITPSLSRCGFTGPVCRKKGGETKWGPEITKYKRDKSPRSPS
jgi:hypothetical protein